MLTNAVAHFSIPIQTNAIEALERIAPESVKDLFAYADALIVGSWYKRDGLWSNPPDRDRVKEMVKAVRAANTAAYKRGIPATITP